jgi:hypothetical protein
MNGVPEQIFLLAIDIAEILNLINKNAKNN